MFNYMIKAKSMIWY